MKYECSVKCSILFLILRVQSGEIVKVEEMCIRDRPTIAQIYSKFSIIYTKGLEKANFLRQYGNVVDLNVIEAPVVPRSFIPILQCPSPHLNYNTFHCALRKALFYADWLTQKHR